MYIATATLQAFIIVVLQALICSQNTLQASLLPEPASSSVLLSNITSDDMIPERAAYRLGRIKWENIAFMSFQVWFLGMVFDATVYQNTAEILALAILNGICAILGAMQVVDGVKWLQLLNETSYSTVPLQTAMRLEIALSVVILLFACVMAYLSYGMSRQFGWNIYKKIGADVQMQSKFFWARLIGKRKRDINAKSNDRNVSDISILCVGSQDRYLYRVLCLTVLRDSVGSPSRRYWLGDGHPDRRDDPYYTRLVLCTIRRQQGEPRTDDNIYHIRGCCHCSLRFDSQADIATEQHVVYLDLSRYHRYSSGHCMYTSIQHWR